MKLVKFMRVINGDPIICRAYVSAEPVMIGGAEFLMLVYVNKDGDIGGNNFTTQAKLDKEIQALGSSETKINEFRAQVIASQNDVLIVDEQNPEGSEAELEEVPA